MPHSIRSLVGGVAALGIAMSAARAQAPQSKTPVDPKAVPVEIPRGLRPPSGMCRVWIDRVPAGQQPAPTDCASAIRNRPPNGRVIFSDDFARKAKPKDPPNPPKDPPKTKSDDRKSGKKPPL